MEGIIRKKDVELQHALNLLQDELKLGLDPEDEPKRASFELVIYWFARIYMDADWSKIARSKNVYAADVFEHKIKSALSKRNIRQINDALCCALGLQSIRIPAMVLDSLEGDRRRILNNLRKEPIYFSIKAIELAKELLNWYKSKNDNDQGGK